MPKQVNESSYVFFGPRSPWPPYTPREQELYDKICQQQAAHDCQSDLTPSDCPQQNKSGGEDNFIF